MFLRRWLTQRTPNTLVGLDIQPETIKLLEINAHDGINRIENFGITTLPAGAIVKDEIKNPDIIANSLKDLFRQYNVKTKNVALAIPRSAAIIKNISVDSRLTPAEIESRAWIEANRYFPDLVGDINLDFSIIGPNAQDSAQLDMVLVACRKEHIKPYLEIIRQSGLTVKIVDVNCYALERAMALINKSDSADNLALLNLNFTLSSLVVVQQNQLIYAHDHTYDGIRLTSQIKKITTPPGAGPGIDPNYEAVLKESLTAHLRHTMHFFYSSRPNVSIQKLIVSGDCATIPYLLEFIKQETNIETELADPFTNMKFDPNINPDELHKSAPGLMLSCGLALSIVR